MTAMFVVIFLDQWLKERRHTSSLLGLGLSLACLLVFGADGFIIPAMLAILGTLTLLRARSPGWNRRMRHDCHTAAAHHRCRRPRNDAHALSPLPALPAGAPTPKYIHYLGTVLPPAVFGCW